MSSGFEYLCSYLQHKWKLYRGGLRKRKIKEYKLFILGKYPTNLSTILKLLIHPETDLRYSVLTNVIILKFESELNFQFLQSKLSQAFQGYAENFLLIEVNQFTLRFHDFGMSEATYHHLYGDIEYTVPNIRLDALQRVLDVLQTQQNVTANIIREIKREIRESHDTATAEETLFLPPTQQDHEAQLEAEVDMLLDKIQKEGYDSLTEEEKTKLAKFGK